jgi:hypothetical protein
MKKETVISKLIKRTFRFNNYVWKSSLLDFISLVLFFCLLFFVIGLIYFQVYQTEIFEQNYGALLSEDTVSEDFRLDIANTYASILRALVLVLALSVAGLILLSFIFGVLFDILQYKALDKTIYHKVKELYSLWVKTLRNLLPLFLSFLILLIVTFLIFSLTMPLLIIWLVLFWAYFIMSFLVKLSSFHNKKFKSSWKDVFRIIPTFFKYSAPYFIGFFLVLIIIFLFTIILTFIQVTILNLIVFLIMLLLVFIVSAFIRKYLYLLIKSSINNIHKKR